MERYQAVIERKGISGSTLKLIAIIIMFIDHIGAVIVERMIFNMQYMGRITISDNPRITSSIDMSTLLTIDDVLRGIGRLGFPIFCFLLIEGFVHTRNAKKYALRLAAFALISEIPFDLATRGYVINAGYQNIFFTLLIGLLVMMAYEKIEYTETINRFGKIALYIVSLLAGMGLAEVLHTDYHAIGVGAIMALYIFRKNKIHQMIAGCACFAYEITAPLAFLPIVFYNGKRGWNMKYVFYAFYPVHLLLLYLIAVWTGIAVL